jgi:hypothetical protein
MGATISKPDATTSKLRNESKLLYQYSPQVNLTIRLFVGQTAGLQSFALISSP